MTLRFSIVLAMLLLAGTAIAAPRWWWIPRQRATASTGGTVDLTTNMIAWWKITADDTGAFIYDWSGNTNYLTQSVSSAYMTISNDGVNVVGVLGGDDEATTVSTSLLNGYTNWMLSCWVRANTWTAGYWKAAVMSRGTGNSVYAVWQASDTEGYLGIMGSFVFFDPSAIVEQWCHVAITCDAGIYRGWTNGVCINPAGTGRFNPATVDAVWRVGRDPDWNYFKGQVDDVRLYKHSDTGQVSQIYQAGRK